MNIYGMIQWFIYSVFFAIILILAGLTLQIHICLSLILGFFGALLNEINNSINK